MIDGQWPRWVREARVGNRKGGALMRPKLPSSPYFGLDSDDWPEVTRSLLAEQPLGGETLVKAVLSSWESIFNSRLGSGFHIGKDIHPTPQNMGSLLHALIPLELAARDANWRADSNASEKDLVYEPNQSYSIEIKTSSHKDQIFGNRSFGVDNPGRGKKAKDGYYVAVNFEKWGDAPGGLPRIRLIRYGWLDHTDWVAQKSQTGQQSSLPAVVANTQLLTVYSAE
ncbi:ScaI family restriction endonuclease [Streptomyces sp. HB2AG]|uniref:ScaI family restriction endonuclease n=1 Tax=Streptomyces sp. HB2AG TaxID=2983400 RepID=UPI0022AA7EFF|nr:ScaI family restriction endonuclease [Streptomyces sp. HB2AG]MCZ2525063.1 ScaI family restriction endonuclease [Streptomyces sp. HB2AG]